MPCPPCAAPPPPVCTGSSAFVLSGSEEAVSVMRLRAERKHKLSIGGVEAKLYHFKLREKMGEGGGAEAGAGVGAGVGLGVAGWEREPGEWGRLRRGRGGEERQGGR